jgi:hypothetical protein
MRSKGTLLPLVVVVPFHPRLWRTMTISAPQPSLPPVSACHLRPLLVTPASIRHPFRNGAVSLKFWPLLVAWTTVHYTAAAMTGYWTRPRRCRRSRALTGREIVSSLKDARFILQSTRTGIWICWPLCNAKTYMTWRERYSLGIPSCSTAAWQRLGGGFSPQQSKASGTRGSKSTSKKCGGGDVKSLVYVSLHEHDASQNEWLSPLWETCRRSYRQTEVLHLETFRRARFS